MEAIELEISAGIGSASLVIRGETGRRTALLTLNYRNYFLVQHPVKILYHGDGIVIVKYDNDNLVDESTANHIASMNNETRGIIYVGDNHSTRTVFVADDIDFLIYKADIIRRYVKSNNAQLDFAVSFKPDNMTHAILYDESGRLVEVYTTYTSIDRVLSLLKAVYGNIKPLRARDKIPVSNAFWLKYFGGLIVRRNDRSYAIMFGDQPEIGLVEIYKNTAYILGLENARVFNIMRALRFKDIDIVTRLVSLPFSRFIKPYTKRVLKHVSEIDTVSIGDTSLPVARTPMFEAVSHKITAGEPYGVKDIVFIGEATIEEHVRDKIVFKVKVADFNYAHSYNAGRMVSNLIRSIINASNPPLRNIGEIKVGSAKRKVVADKFNEAKSITIERDIHGDHFDANFSITVSNSDKTSIVRTAFRMITPQYDTTIIVEGERYRYRIVKGLTEGILVGLGLNLPLTRKLLTTTSLHLIPVGESWEVQES